MKFKFKIQQYQTDAVDAVVRVFDGQPYQDHVSYRRDIGQAQAQQMSFSVGENGEVEDIETGFKNAVIELSDDQLLRTIPVSISISRLHRPQFLPLIKLGESLMLFCD